MELNQPLGMTPPPPKPRRRPGLIAVSAIAGVAVGGVAFAVLTADPHGGEPYAVATIPPPAGTLDPANTPTPDPTPTGSLGTAEVGGSYDGGRPGRAPNGAGTLEGGIKVFRGGQPETQVSNPPAGGPLVIDVTKALDEASRHRPTDSGPVVTHPAASATTASPRVALFVSGMGLSDTATRTAIATMPPAVDLAFVPYGAMTDASVDAAKAKGHEILLQVPMQTSQGSPGPHALRPNEPASELAEDIGWLMDRVHGYAGVTNLLGAPVTANATTMSGLLKAVATRGVFYLDDGTSKRSLAMELAPEAGVAMLQADVVIDATGDPNVVRANLGRLVALAKQNGHAIGMASGLPDHMATIARFAADLADQGVTLVPVGTLAGHDANVATAR